MSWDAHLLCDGCGGDDFSRSWNYTHNTSRMANTALVKQLGEQPDTWWAVLNGMTGPDGAKMLDLIIGAMEAEPPVYIAMEPENGWGSYKDFLATLKSMRDAVPEYPTHWHTSG